MPPICAQTNTLYSRLVAHFYDPIMRGMENSFLETRRRELLRHAQGKILEVGAGTGANFHLYSSQAQVLAVEPSGAMLKYARRRLAQGTAKAHIELLEAGKIHPLPQL